MVARLVRSSLLVTTLLAACGGSAPTTSEAQPPQRMCTLMFVYSGLEADVTGPWTDAPVEVEVSAGGQSLTVEAHGAANAAHCGAGATNQDLGCVARNAAFELHVAPPMAPDQPAHLRIASVGAPGGPAELTITVRHGAASTTRTLRPAYQTTEPNGPGCGEVVKARASLALGS
jgi:hypothetical protein